MTTSSTSPPSSGSAPGVRLGDTAVRAWWTGRHDGDLSSLQPGGAPPAPLPDTLTVARLRQVHGAEVHVVGTAAPAGARRWDPPSYGDPLDAGDALVADGAQWCLAVFTADCGAVALASPSGAYGVVHAGWRGVLAGVIEHSVAAVRAVSGDASGAVVAGLGPCIGPCCYEFSPADLDAVALSYGAGVRALTSAGAPALDLPAAIRRALQMAGVEARIRRRVVHGLWP